MESLKIAVVSDWFYPKVGGIETHIDELATRLVRLGHEVHVFTHDYRKYEWGGHEPARPYAVHRLHGRFYIKAHHISLGPGALIEANAIYKKVGFDITHVHSLYSPLGLALANLSRGIRGVPVVATNHSLFSWSNPVARALLPILRRELRRIDCFIAVSSVVADDTRRVLGRGLRLKPVYVVPNAVDPKFWRPPEPEERKRARRRLGIDEDESVVVVVGRLTRRKAVHTAPRIVRRAAELLGRRITLVIVGDGPLRERVEEEAARHSNGLLRVELRGFMEREALRSVYWAGDVLLLTSHMEAFSITALEAMASGMVVVGYADSGVRDILQHGGGVLVEDEMGASKALAGFFADRERLEVQRRRAVQVVQERFSWDTVLPRILSVYRSTIDYAGLEDYEYLLHRIWVKLSRKLSHR